MYKTVKIGCLILCFIAANVLMGYAQEPFAIKDAQFINRSIPEGMISDVAIEDSGGGNWSLSKPPGKENYLLAFSGGEPAIWGHGSIHTLLSKILIFGYVFDSDKDEPLQFIVDKDKGYVYVKGKGSVTTPEGKIVKLPLKSKKKR